jgi:chromosome segregation ATPase
MAANSTLQVAPGSGIISSQTSFSLGSFPVNPTSPPTPSPEIKGDALVRLLREELVKTQVIVLELNDRVLAKETDKADAVTILGKVELVLEEKINYIAELDRALNDEIKAAKRDLAAAQETAKTVGQTHEAQVRDAQRVLQDHVDRLEAANQEISRMHGVAGGFARDLAQTRETLATSTKDLAETRGALTATLQKLATSEQTLADTRVKLAQTEEHLRSTAQSLADEQAVRTERDAQLVDERRRLSLIFNSALWKAGRPWRALFGPKV